MANVVIVIPMPVKLDHLAALTKVIEKMWRGCGFGRRWRADP